MFWLTTAVALAAAIASIWQRSIDGVSGYLWSLFLEEDTVWADGYTDESFRAARVGMTRSEIYALLGPPLYTWDNGAAGLVEWWTESPADTHYRQRALVFQGDRVVEKIGEYWVD